MTFTAHIFKKISDLAASGGVRFVAIQRRDYPMSSPIPPVELSTLAEGTDEEKAAYLRARGIEIATFIDRFLQENQLPPPDKHGAGGGFAVVGWSLGCVFALAALANLDALDDAAQARFSRHMRSLVLLDAPHSALGMPGAPQTWTPFRDDSIPLALRAPFFNNWISAYFAHGDLGARGLDAIEYIVPAPTRAPSIYNMDSAEHAANIYNDTVWASDAPLLANCSTQLHATYQKVVFDKTLRERLPKMRICALVADAAASFSLVAMLKMREDDEAHGGKNIEIRVVKGRNHFMHWDDPETTLRAILDTMV
ncbi:hypothetical protein PsYK624_155340 [Phanerochaete sordida]|uniref:AB hydrolase-1 domain-containing protein n=1 Tax=Phanerochaete sordida TaxID=48140 RepID=A0A9P3LL80_9APHY|nr:hypothetical protein PsYK624_155340 [Phanerochaete sordida]